MWRVQVLELEPDELLRIAVDVTSKARTQHGNKLIITHTPKTNDDRGSELVGGRWVVTNILFRINDKGGGID